jgi:P4 family phage/plasmid primase-like protien
MASKFPHFYFFCKDGKNLKIFENDKKVTLADIQFTGKFVVGPGSTHPSGVKYEVLDDLPIVEIEFQQILYCFQNYLQYSHQTIEKKGSKIEEEDETIRKIKSKIKIIDILKKYGIDTTKNPTDCLWHESDRGKCFSFTDETFHCFHCGESGSIFHLIMKQENCDFIKAKKKLAELTDVEIPQSLPATFFTLDKNGNIKTFIPKYLGEHIKIDYIFKTMRKGEDIFYYKEGYYSDEAISVIKEECTKRLSSLCRINYINETINHIKNTTFYNSNPNSYKHLINLKNGLFNLQTYELEKHSSDYFLINQSPIVYNPKADCPTIKDFLKQVLREEDIPIIQEIFGYCLLKDHFIQKAFMFLGDGANGKSTLLNLMKIFLGEKNICAISLQDISTNRFATSNLYGKLANIYPDLTDSALKQTGLFKVITGGDSILAERKFKEGFMFTNYAKLIFSANKLPESDDETSAYYRRWIYVNFPNVFEGDECDKNILNKLITDEELSGLFNWALEGLKRLLENQEFSHSLSTEESQEFYERASSPIKAFVMDMIDDDSMSLITKDELFSEFVRYCNEKGLPVSAKNSFSRALSEHLPNIKTERPKILGVQTPSWRGIKLKK